MTDDEDAPAGQKPSAVRMLYERYCKGCNHPEGEAIICAEYILAKHQNRANNRLAVDLDDALGPAFQEAARLLCRHHHHSVEKTLACILKAYEASIRQDVPHLRRLQSGREEK